jgi:hypothetical protein
MDIRKHLGRSVVFVVLLLASGIPGFARNSRTIALTHKAVLSGTTLPAGKYDIRWEAQSNRATVEIAQGKKVVLSTQCSLEDRGKKYDTNTVIYNTAADGTDSISEIRFAGSSEVLVFNE